MCTNQPSSQYQNPDKGGIKFPCGYILVNKRWTSDPVGRELAKRTKISYSDAMGFVDFYITQECPVIYFSESDLKTKKRECQEKVSKLNSVSSSKGLVIATWNSNVLSEFSDIQEYATLDVGLLVIPVTCHSQLPAILHKLAVEETKSPQKTRKGSGQGGTSLGEQVSLLTNVPGIGEKEAKSLLQRFGNIVSVCEASKDVLENALGENLGTKVFNFFNQPIT
ncbi:hypothetical protein R5R35_008452 [Gryllus longicercus]|uniref:Fanconi anemia core complex-associated protein 24 pseudonuclease domain-containing protein n=1 Tax=Gryllus longicercus TaxID=2509291 RepID=A0AAN9VFI1_9ORTH|nr:Uncharacterized protein GBIM_11432 [Gryllus bimaculatus]